jgi:hypothetical protein
LIASISPPSEPATQDCTEEEVSNGISSCLSQNGKLADITYLGTWPSLARCYRMTRSAHDLNIQTETPAAQSRRTAGEGSGRTARMHVT